MEDVDHGAPCTNPQGQKKLSVLSALLGAIVIAPLVGAAVGGIIAGFLFANLCPDPALILPAFALGFLLGVPCGLVSGLVFGAIAIPALRRERPRRVIRTLATGTLLAALPMVIFVRFAMVLQFIATESAHIVLLPWLAGAVGFWMAFVYLTIKDDPRAATAGQS